MYNINFRHKGSTVEYALYRTGDKDYCLTSGKLSLEMGKAGELKVSLPVTNPATANIRCLTDEVIVYRDSVEIWRGRAITSQQDFNLTGTLTCEGVLAYLYDTYHAPFAYEGTPVGLLQEVINNHNSFVHSDKQFQLGNITVSDPNNHINRSSEEYLRTIDVLSSRFVESSLGGYFRVRVVNGVKYLDYLSSYNNTATQDIEFGSNILDLASQIEYGSAITAVLPLGARNEDTGERLTVSTVNSGDIYVRDSNLISSRGFICEQVIWDDVTIPSNLLSRAQAYLAQASAFVQTFSVKAIDLHWEDATNVAWNLGDSVKVYSEPHSINQYSELNKMNLDLLNPTNDVYDFGIVRTSNSLVGRTASIQRNIRDSISNVEVSIHRFSADYATIDYLSANYATIALLESEYASIDRLEVEKAIINDAIAAKANITDLNAANADISNLQANYANIATILSGNVGTGQLQTITLNAQNATIDAASINLATLRNLLAQYITVGDLLAGRISTNDFTVGSDDGAFNITGATLAIKDGEGNTRIQIGKDGQGNFTFTLFDEDGQGVLINETGIQDADAIADGLISNIHVADDAAIAGTKLDIASVVSAINGSQSTVNATHVYLDETNQTLAQTYSQLSTSVTNVTNAAQTANDNANRAMRAIEGISSLDNLTAILTNDAHVVHTLTDGSSGDYTNANTSVYVYRGDTDVTDYSIVIVNPSSSVTGTWNDTTKTYQITGLSADNGYVDFDVSYGVNTSYLLMPDDKRLVMPDGNALKLPIAAHVYKRFSISKSRDGRVGISYKIQSSIGIIRRTRDGSLNPSTVTFSAKYSDGSGLFSYSGKYVIAESQDGNTWTTAYESEDVEASKTFTPTTGTRFIRATLLNEEDTQLDTQTVTIIADADELATDLQAAETAIVSITERVGTVETGINGLQVNLHEMETQIQGVADKNLVYTTPYTIDGDDVTFTARVYKNGTLVTTEYPESWFSWLRRTEDGDEMLGTGYTLETQKSLMGIGGGVIIGRFETFDDSALVLPDNKYLIMPDDKRLTIFIGDAIQLSKHDYYSNYVVTDAFSFTNGQQGFDIYDNVLAVWSDPAYTITLRNAQTGNNIATIATSGGNHGNDLSFSPNFYDPSDPLPLLYVGMSLCFRLIQNASEWSATLLHRLTTPNIYGMKIADAFNGDTLITIGYSENKYTYSETNKLIIATWDMTNLTDNGDGSYTPALIDTVTRDWLECIQGASYHDGYLWVACGLGNSTTNGGHIYALDIDTGDIEIDIDLEDNGELEGMAWGYSVTDGWYILVGQMGIGVRKVTFPAPHIIS